MANETHAVFEEIVLRGLREPGGMPRFESVFDEEDARKLHAWLIEQARTAATASTDS
jgi:hypothetical protein